MGETAAAVVQWLLALMPVLGNSPLNTSVLMLYFVSMFDGLRLPEILWMDTVPASAKLCMNMNFSSMWLALFDIPWRDAMDLPADLSEWILVLSLWWLNASLMKFGMRNASWHPAGGVEFRFGG